MLFAILVALVLVGIFTIFAGWLLSIINGRLPIIYQFKHPFLMAFIGMGIGYATLIVLAMYSERFGWSHVSFLLVLLVLMMFVYGYYHIKKTNLIHVRKWLLGIALTLMSPTLYILLIVLLIFAVDLFR